MNIKSEIEERLCGIYGVMLRIDAANVRKVNAALLRAANKADADDAITLTRLAAAFELPSL